MEKDPILEKLEIIQQVQNEILRQIQLLSSPAPGEVLSENWIDSLQVLEILGISDRTLRRHKKKKILTPVSIGGRDYYFKPHIFATRDSYLK